MLWRLYFSHTGAALCFVAHGDLVLGAIAMSDAPRLEAAEALGRLKVSRSPKLSPAVVEFFRHSGTKHKGCLQALGVISKMLTGDADGPARSIAGSVGLPQQEVFAALLPEGKLEMVCHQDHHLLSNCRISHTPSVLLTI